MMDNTKDRSSLDFGGLIRLVRRKAGLITAFFLVFLGIGLFKNYRTEPSFRVNFAIDCILIRDVKEERPPNSIDRAMVERIIQLFTESGLPGTLSGCVTGIETVPYLPPKPQDKAPRAIEGNIVIRDTACFGELMPALVDYLNRQPLIHNACDGERQRLEALKASFAGLAQMPATGDRIVVYPGGEAAVLEKISEIDYKLKHLSGVEVVVGPVLTQVTVRYFNNIVLFSLLGIVLGILAAVASVQLK